MGFVGLRWTPADRDQGRAARALAEKLDPDWTCLLDWRGLLLLHRGAQASEELPNGMGFVFGERFGREADPSPPCSERVDPVPNWIAERWGSYVAVLVDRGFDIVRVLRDPSGACACYLSDLQGVRLFFSDADAFVRLNPGVAPDLGFVRAFLRYPLYLGRRTGFMDVDELAPGECVVYPREGEEIEARWTPRRYALASDRLDWVSGVETLRCATEASIKARTSKSSRIGLRLSGGFDSSVMLGLLRRCSDAEVVCVNEYWEGAPEGDEREQARFVANANGVEMRELRIDPATVRYELALNAPLTFKPTLSILSFGSPEVTAFYADLGCDPLTSGQGGDHLFHRSRTPWIAADALRDSLDARALLRIALETARLTRRSVWDVFIAMGQGAIGVAPESAHRSAAMGVMSVGDDEEAPANHTWLRDLRWHPPARVIRIHQFLGALSYHDESNLSAVTNVQSLLLSQPIMECCLRTPPYVMTAGGKERSLARAAFADLVPERVAARVSKGETTRYFAAVLAANQHWIRSILSGGQLEAMGVINKTAMTAALDRNWVQDGLAADGLYSLIAAECWLRNLAKARTLFTV